MAKDKEMEEALAMLEALEDQCGAAKRLTRKAKAITMEVKKAGNTFEDLDLKTSK